MEKETSKLIGIAGGSCSGKTTLVRALHERLRYKITPLSFDDYFVDLEALPKAVTDFETPNLYHYDRLASDLTALKAGKTVEIQCNSDEAIEEGITSRIVVPSENIVLEGFLIFHEPKTRALFDIKIFIDIPEEELVKRRLKRGRGKEHITWNTPEYINSKVLPGHRKFVLPQKKYADVVCDGMKPTNQLLDEILIYLK